jgi:hypothetical protein
MLFNTYGIDILKTIRRSILLTKLLKGFMKGRHGNKKQILPFIITSFIVFFGFITDYFFSQNDLLLFFVFVSLVPIFAVLKLDGRIPICYAIVLFVFAALTEDYKNSLSVFSYWLLVDGVSCMLIDLFRKKSDNFK